MRFILTAIFVALFTMPIAKAKLPTLNKLMGQFDETIDDDFIALDDTMLPTNKPGMYLQKEAAIQLMFAYIDFKYQHPDVPFVIVSATRNYQYQYDLWQNKWQMLSAELKDDNKTMETILNYTSIPGTSRHHWGTDIDITSLSSSYFHVHPKGKILYQWLNENMPKYGFCKPYSNNRTAGHKPEEWHWSYKPISSTYLQQFKNYFSQHKSRVINKFKFKGYENLELSNDLEKFIFSFVVEEFIFNINDECK